MSFGAGGSQKQVESNSKVDPWAPTIPYLQDFLRQANKANTPGATTAQTGAFDALEKNAAAGNPFTGEIQNLAKDQLGTQSNSKMVMDANTQMQSRLGDYANGKYLDFNSNPYVSKMLETSANDVQNRINQMFAGSGRDITGNAAGQQAVARGITQAQLPILSDLYTREQQNQIQAAQLLNQSATSAATTGQGLDVGALNARTAGVDTGNAYLAARDAGQNQLLNLEQQKKTMGLGDLGLYADLLLRTAGLGGTQAGTQTQSGSNWGFNIAPWSKG